jgi:hypothetical protein
MPAAPSGVGRAEHRLLAPHRQRAGVRLQHPAQDLDQRALAGAVLTDERVHLAEVGDEVRAVAGAHGTEGLLDAVRRQRDAAVAARAGRTPTCPSVTTRQAGSRSGARAGLAGQRGVDADLDDGLVAASVNATKKLSSSSGKTVSPGRCRSLVALGKSSRHVLLGPLALEDLQRGLQRCDRQERRLPDREPVDLRRSRGSPASP